MSDLRALTDKARSAQKYKTSAKKPVTEPKSSTKSKPRKKPSKPVTANSQVRDRVGAQPSGMTHAERQAERRKKLARISCELSVDEKASLMKSAEDNGRSLTGEIRHRLGLE